MTKNEFKSWFDGFCEGMEGAPNDKQWERIKARVAEINDVATPYPVFVDRYVAPYRPYWPNVPLWGVASSSGGFVQNHSSAIAVGNSQASGYGDAIQPFMKDAGRAEYRAALNS